MTSTRNSPSQQLELLTGPGSGPSKHDTMDTIDYSPDIIPKEQGNLLVFEFQSPIYLTDCQIECL